MNWAKPTLKLLVFLGCLYLFAMGMQKLTIENNQRNCEIRRNRLIAEGWTPPKDRKLCVKEAIQWWF